MNELELQVTLQPNFFHFERFANDSRISAIRFNSAGMSTEMVEDELNALSKKEHFVPVYFDVKGRQLRITKVNFNPNFLDIELNHPIEVETPTPVLFKAGADDALLKEVGGGGNRLIFDGGPGFMVYPGESLHIRDESLKVLGSQFTDIELNNIKLVKSCPEINGYFLSYVQNKQDVDEFLSLVGPSMEVYLKIEDKKGLNYIETEFKNKDNLNLVAARGDLYVETERPHEILKAIKLIISKDPKACAGSRMLLSVVETPTQDTKEILRAMDDRDLTGSEASRLLFSLIRPTVPACSDFSELAWLYDIGYRKMLLCDEICLKEELLATAVNAFDAFRKDYAQNQNESHNSGLLKRILGIF